MLVSQVIQDIVKSILKVPTCSFGSDDVITRHLVSIKPVLLLVLCTEGCNLAEMYFVQGRCGQSRAVFVARKPRLCVCP